MTGTDNDELHRQQVTDAYRSSVRLRLYAMWAAAFGVVVMIAVLGAMLIGWLSISDGLTWFGLAVLVALVPAANFYSDAARTTVSAAGMERQMDVCEDLSQRLRLTSLLRNESCCKTTGKCPQSPVDQFKYGC